MAKKLFKTVFTVEVLSEEPIDNVSLAGLDYEITEGHCSGIISKTESVIVPIDKAVEEIQNQGTDPEFFGFYEGVTVAAISEFLQRFATKVKENEESAYVELMMDNHKCIEYDGVQYYIPEDCSSYGEHEENIIDYLTD